MPHTVIPFESTLRHALQSAQWAGLRHSSETTTQRVVRNDRPERNQSSLEEGAMCEVLVDGHFGYAATADLSGPGLQRAFDRAIATSRATSPYKVHAFGPSQRPRAQGSYRSPRQRDLDTTSLAEITDCLVAASQAMKLSDALVNRSASAMLIQTEINFFSSNGSDTRQSFDMADVTLSATAAEGLESQTRSWSRTGQLGGEVFHRAALAQQAEDTAREALALLQADNCPSARMDLILMPDQMMLQIHESVGHPLELDRILGDERNYAGSTFVKASDIGSLRYGSNLMNITFDPTLAGEAASYGADDIGNPATREYIVKDGILVRGLGSLESQQRSGKPGVANQRAQDWFRAPIDRIANL
ncbi:MAG: TldD/PmbA family protein, partial [Rhodoferax sp.]|nr:TldD/PmbA family protein [Rhodoferax sp.]